MDVSSCREPVTISSEAAIFFHLCSRPPKSPTENMDDNHNWSMHISSNSLSVHSEYIGNTN